jgi:hypothetical protein
VRWNVASDVVLAWIVNLEGRGIVWSALASIPAPLRKGQRLNADNYARRCSEINGAPSKRLRLAAARAVSLSALTGDGTQMIIATSSISPIPITSTATATGS